MPRLSRIRQVYLSACVWPKSLVWRCQFVMKAPRPMIHCWAYQFVLHKLIRVLLREEEAEDMHAGKGERTMM